MTSTIPETPQTPANEEARYGIRRVTMDQFEIGGYRYTNLADAIAEGKRRQRKADGS